MKSKGKDVSVGGPCPADCPICAREPELEHDLTASQHTGIPPDGIMDLCPKCVADDPNAFHYQGDWHRKMVRMMKTVNHAN